MYDIVARKKWILVIITMFNFNNLFVIANKCFMNDKIMEKKERKRKLEMIKCDSALRGEYFIISLLFATEVIKTNCSFT